MKDFDFQTADLSLPALIEASAGTGKTFVLERLLERLLTEPSGKKGDGPVPLQEILVVTFSEKATRELRERIHAHLKKTADNAELPETRRRLLQAALLEYDSASIHTLHGFCQKLLRDHALDFGALFQTETGGEEALVSLVRDGFRKWENAAAKESLKAFLDAFENIGQAETFLLKLLRSEAPQAMPAASLWVRCEPDREVVEMRLSAAFLKEQEKHLTRCFEALKQSGFTREDVERGIESSGLPKKKYNKTVVAKTTEGLELLQIARTLREVLALSPLFEAFSRETIAEKAGEGFTHVGGADWVRWIECVTAFVGACAACLETETLREEALRCDFLHRFVPEVWEAFQKHKEENRRLTYDDMIRKVHGALTGTGRADLLRGVRSRYRAVLLDEFQDTDRLQWEIFETLFVNPPHPVPLYLVGDPKQSIYRFRGADLPVYFEAKRVLKNAHPLSVNFRAHPDLLEGLNRLFLLAPLFPDAQAIRYMPSRPAPNPGAPLLEERGLASSPVEFLALPPLGAGASRKLLYEHVAQTLETFFKPDSPFRLGNAKLRPGDVALLTRTNRECAEAAEALRRYRIPCVIASPEGLWQTAEAGDLETFLQAVANPGDETRVKRALLTFFFDLSPQDLLALSDPENESHRRRFWEWHEALAGMRLSQALTRVWGELSVFPKQLAKPEGERIVTNLNHLLEKIMEQEEERVRSPEEWIEPLQELRKLDAEKEPLRLETDGDAVPILTIHKSKGLEFPVVFLAGGIRGDPPSSGLALCHYSEGGKKVFDLSASPEGLKKAAEEELSESRRLLYVAMTRAKSKLFLPLAPENPRFESLANLLWGAKAAPSPAEWIRSVENAAFLKLTPVAETGPGENAGDREWGADPGMPLSPGGIPGAGLAFQRSSPGDFSPRRRSWTSFSALVSSGRNQPAAETALFFPAEDEGAFSAESKAAPTNHFKTLPKGPETGNLLHQVLETLPFEWLAGFDSFSAFENSPEFQKTGALLRSALQRHALSAQYERALCRIVWDALKASLPGLPALTLSGLGLRRHEAEFVLAVNPSLHTLLSLDLEEGGRLEFRFDLNAFFVRGFVDLIFEQNGKYYIADWKSNHLGDGAEDYASSRILESMREHRYFLQYSLYATALCLFLKKQNPGFSLENDFGGVYYFYLRGMREKTSNGIFFHKPEPEELRRFAAQFLKPGQGL